MPVSLRRAWDSLPNQHSLRGRNQAGLVSPGCRPCDSNLLRQPGAGPQVPGWGRAAPPQLRGPFLFPGSHPQEGREHGSHLDSKAWVCGPWADLSKGNLLFSLSQAEGVNQDVLVTLLGALYQGQSNPHADSSVGWKDPWVLEDPHLGQV